MNKVKLLLYCTKAKPLLWKSRETGKIRNIFYIGTKEWFKDELLNGKIVAECDCDVEEIFRNEDCECYTKSLSGQAFCHFSLLNEEQLNKYFGFVSEITKVGYALHLSNLKIFDTPKELNDYCLHEIVDHVFFNEKEIKKAPQNMCRVYDKKLTRTEKGDGYVLISIKPEWICKILNGEKTIEVRREVLNCMKEK